MIRRGDRESRLDADVQINVEGVGQMTLAEFFDRYDTEDEDQRMVIRHAMDGEYFFTGKDGQMLLVAVPE